MDKSKILKASISIVTALLFFLACAAETPVPDISEESDENFADMANPAAVYCEGLGYSLESVTRDGGADSDCIFPDGSRCAQWDFLSGRCGQEFTYCTMQGYQMEEGSNIGICRFSDGSSCGEFQFFSGDCSPGDNPGEVELDSVRILGFSDARDFIAAYFSPPIRH